MSIKFFILVFNTCVFNLACFELLQTSCHVAASCKNAAGKNAGDPPQPRKHPRGSTVLFSHFPLPGSEAMSDAVGPRPQLSNLTTGINWPCCVGIAKITSITSERTQLRHASAGFHIGKMVS